MTPALLQRTWPIAMAILGIAAAALVVATCNLGPLPVSVPAASMTFGIVVSGFVATQRNMLLTMSGAEVLQFAVRTGYHKEVIRYLMGCCRCWVACDGNIPVWLILGQE